MKTQIVQLESHDDVISVRDKIGWSKARRILLIFPVRGRILTRRLDLVLVRRSSQQLGAQLALVTSHPDVIDHAYELGIPVFPNISKAQQVSWRRVRRKPLPRRPTQQHLNVENLRASLQALHPLPRVNAIVRILAFFSAVLAVLGLVLFFFPGATVHITLPQMEQTLDLQVWANPNVSSPGISGGVPAHIVRITVEGNAEANSSGIIRLPDKPATGMVRLTNLTIQEVFIPAGTVVTTLIDPKLRYETTQDTTIPAGNNQAADVTIQSLSPGRIGNIEAGAILAMEGDLGLSLSVKNIEATSGGSDQVVPAASSSDINTLRQNLLKNLQQVALNDLQTNSPAGLTLLADTLDQGKVIEEQREPAEGQPGDRLTLWMRVEFSAWSISDEDIHSVATTALDATLPTKQVAVPGSLIVSALGKLEQVEGNVRWDVMALRKTRPVWSEETIRGLLAGKKVKEVNMILNESYHLQEPVKVTISPNWWVYMPFLPFRIQVEVK
jgi:hypothetical protein